MKKCISLGISLFCLSLVSAQNFDVATNKTEATNFADIEREFLEWQNNKTLDQTKGWKWYKRWLDHTAQRTPLSGIIADPAIFNQHAVNYTKNKLQQQNKSAANWVPVGPNYEPADGGYEHGVARVNCIAFHPTDSNTFWVGVGQGGIWKTDNGGGSWTPQNEGLPILRISDIQVDPNNAETLYASIGDFEYNGVSLKIDDRKRNTHYGLGLYKSINGGDSWFATGLTAEQTDLDYSLLRGILIDPNNSNNLIAGGLEGVWKSTDAGVSWNQVLADTLICDLEIDPLNPNTIYVASTHMPMLGNAPAGVLKSTNFGDTWELLNTGIPATDVRRVAIAVSPTDPNFVYALACGIDRGFYGIYASEDAGQTWSQRASHTDGMNYLAWSGDAGQVGGQGSYDLTLLVSPTNKNEIYLGGVNAWGSTDGGTNWNMVSFWQTSLHADLHQFKSNPLDNKVYICHDGGISRTNKVEMGSWNDQSWPTVWENISYGMQTTSFYRLGLSKNNPGAMIAGAQDNSTFYNDGTQWYSIIGGDGMECIIHPDEVETFWGSYQYGGLVSYTNGSYSYGLESMIKGTGEQGEWTTPLLLNNEDLVLYAGFGNLWESQDYGFSWSKLSDFAAMPGAGFPAPASAIAQSTNNTETFYIAKRIYHSYNQPSELWRTFDNGNSWFNATAGLPDSLYFTYIAVDNDDPNTAWVTCSGFSQGQKVFKTTNGGVSWTNISSNLPNIPVNCVILDEQSAAKTIYLATDLGIYTSNDTNSTWELFGTDLPNVIVSELEIHYDTREIYAATFGRGLWKSALPNPVGINELGASLASINILPNPNSGTFNLNSNFVENFSGEIQVIDIMGKVLYKNSINIRPGAQLKEIALDLKSGIYFLQLGNMGLSKTLKFLVE